MRKESGVVDNKRSFFAYGADKGGFRLLLVKLLWLVLVVTVWASLAETAEAITARVTFNTYAAFQSQNSNHPQGEIIFFRSDASATASGCGYDEVPNGNNARLTLSGNVTNSTVNLGGTAGYFTANFNDKTTSGGALNCSVSPISFCAPSGYMSGSDNIDVTITCTVPDTTGPVQQSAVVNAAGTTLTISYDENIDSYSDAGTGEFTVTVAGTARTVNSVTLSGSTAVLTLASPVNTGQTVTVSYSNGVGYAVYDDAFNEALSFTNFAVTNNSTVAGSTPPTVTTQAVTSVSSATATGNGTITSLGTPNPTQYGVVWNTSTGPTIANSKTTQGAIAATGAFTSSMTGLAPNTTYYVKAYATNTAGTSYGGEVSFTTLPTYTVTYNGNGNTGGTAPSDGSSPYVSGSTVTVLGNTGTATRTGYTFAGWNTAANGSGTNYSAGNTFSIAGNTTLYAKWTGTVTYNGNGNTGGNVPVDATAYLPGALVTAAANSGALVKSGFTFAGWNTAANGSGTTYAAGSDTFAMSGNVTLYAKWTSSVTYNGNGNSSGTVPTDSTAYLNSATVTVLGNTGSLTRTGFTFAGWNTAADGSGTTYSGGSTFTITANTTLYAKWTGTVTYNGNGNTGGNIPVDATAYLPGALVVAATNSGALTRTGFTFAGWNTAANGSGTTYAAGSGTFPMTGNVTLYAKWTSSVTYNGNGNSGGTAPTDASAYLNNATVTVLGNTGSLTRTGLTFAGWNTAADGSGTSYSGGSTFTITANTTLYAKWTGTVTYNGNGNTGGSAPTDGSSPYNNGATVTVLGNTGNLTKTGHIFAGWNTAANGSGISRSAGGTFIIASSTILYAQWTALSTVSTLSSLSLSTGTLNPAFASGTTSYTASVANGVTSISVTPAVTDSTATITVNGTTVTSGSSSGSINLNVGGNTITIIGTAEDGITTSTYTIAVTRAATQTIGAISFTPSTLIVSGTTTASATASSALAVSFSSLTPAVCTVSGTTVTGVTAGVCTIAANQAGNASYDAAPQVTKNITVAAAANKVHLTHNSTTTDYTTIQSAVDAAVDGDTVSVDAGTFVEQVTVTKAITLQGAGNTTIIRAPVNASLIRAAVPSLKGAAAPRYAVLDLETTTAGLGTVTVKNLAIDGNYEGFTQTGPKAGTSSTYFIGIATFNTNATIDNVTIQHMAAAPLDAAGIVDNGWGIGFAIMAEGGATLPDGAGNPTGGAAAPNVTVTIQNSTIDTFQKAGIIAWGPKLNAVISNNSISGSGIYGNSGQNGMQIGSAGARTSTTATISGNIIDNLGAPDSLVSGTPSWNATGILLVTAGAVEAYNNTISLSSTGSLDNSLTGIDVGYTSAAANVHDNTFNGMSVGIQVSSPLITAVHTISTNTLSTSGGKPVVFHYDPAGNGGETIANFATGYAIRVVGENFTSGTVTAGNGTGLAANSVQATITGSATTLYIDTTVANSSATAPLTITLNGTYLLGNFVLDGEYIRFGKIAQTATVSNSPVTYDGGAKSATVTCAGGGAASNILTGGASSQTAAGTYAVTVDCAASANYNAATGLSAGSFVIGKATPTASITNSPAIYSGSAQTATVACLGGGTATLASGGSGTNAGSYAATVDCAASANYNAATGLAAGNFVINKATPTASIINSPVIYNGAAQGAAVACLGGGGAGNILTGGAAGQTNAGTYAVLADCAASINYNAATGLSAGNFVIGTATQSISFPAITAKTFGNADFDPGATSSSTLAVSYASDNSAVATVTPGGLVHIVGQGSATITATQAGDGNYLAATAVQQTLTVSKAMLTVTADSTSRAYGAANPSFTASYSGFVGGNDASVLTGSPAFTTAANAGSPVGSYAITPALGTLTAANYDFTFADGTLAVGLANQSITFNALPAKTYGDAAFTLSATGGASGNAVTFASSDTNVATVSGATVTIIGAGTATITATQAGTGNYASATAQQTLTVNKATLTVTADNVSRPYNSANPGFTVSYNGFVNSEGVSVLTGAPVLSTTATITSPVGSYPITAAIGTLVAANYTFSFTGGTLAIGIASQNITFDALAAKTYGDSPFTLSASATSGLGVTFASSNSAVATVSGSTVTITGAGSATITATQAGDGNYASATTTQALTINKANLTVTPVDASRAYNSANPGLTASYSGFANGEDAAVLQGAPALSTTATIASPVGNYPITATVGNLFSNNYNFTYGSGTLTIDKAAATVTLGNLNATYDGTAKSVAATTAPDGLVVAVTYNGSATAPTAVGNYAIAAVINDTNYSGTANGTLVIGKATAAVTLGNLNVIYDGAAKAAMITTIPSGLATTVTYNGSAAVPVTVGSYTVTAMVNDASYSGTTTGTLVIAKATPVIAWSNPATIVYGTALSSTQLNATADVAGSFSYSPASGTVLNAGSAQTLATVFTPADAANYTIAAKQATIDVSKAPQVITFGALAAQTVGAADVTLGATASSGLTTSYVSSNPAVAAIVGDTLHLVGVGTATIVASQPGSANYTAATPVSQTLTVSYNSAAPTLVISALSDGATTTDTTQNISGVVTDVNGIASLTINGTVVPVNSDGSFSYPVQLLTGANSITIVATSHAGLASSATRTIILDSSAPHLTVIYPPDNKVVTQNTVTVTGNIAELFTTAKATAKTVAAISGGMTVTYTVNGSAPQTAALTDTTYSFTANLGDGMNTINVSAVSDSGKTAQAKRTVSYQPAFSPAVTDPVFSLAITDPAVDVRTVQESYLLTGTVADNTAPVAVTVTMDGQSYTPTVVNGTFQQQLSLGDAKVYQVSVTGTDQNSNSLTVQRNIIHTVPTAATGSAASTPFTIVDALLSLKMAVGTVTPDTAQTLRMDVAPMVNGVSVGDGKIDVEDVLVILYMAIGLI